MTYKKLLFVSSFLMIIFSIAYLIKPDLVIMGDQYKVDLEKLIPQEFNDWKAFDGNAVINPEVEGGIQDKIYNQTLSRSFTNSKGQKVMLSIAYGKEQKDDLAVHFPEACYPAQGFTIKNEKRSILNVFDQDLNVKQLVTQNRNRNELVTYWVRAGDQIVTSKLDQKLTVLKYAVTGKLPDGLIFRTSTINTPNGFEIQEKFIKDLTSSLAVKDACFLLGQFAGAGCAQ